MAKLPHKEEFPPLLPQGFHPLPVDEVRELCVEPFPTSLVRADIMAGLLAVMERIESVGMVCEVWLDGSFTTKKLDPDDVDFIVIAPSHYRSEGTKEQAELIEWLINSEDEPKKLFRCHTDVLLEFPIGSPWFHLAEETKEHWENNVFGYSVTTHEPKGIIVIKIDEKQKKVKIEKGGEQ